MVFIYHRTFIGNDAGVSVAFLQMLDHSACGHSLFRFFYRQRPRHHPVQDVPNAPMYDL